MLIFILFYRYFPTNHRNEYAFYKNFSLPKQDLRIIPTIFKRLYNNYIALRKFKKLSSTEIIGIQSIKINNEF